MCVALVFDTPVQLYGPSNVHTHVATHILQVVSLSPSFSHTYTLTYPLKRIRTHPEAQGQAAVLESQSDCGVVLRNIEKERMFSFCSCKGILSAPVIVRSIYVHLFSPLLHFFTIMSIYAIRLVVFNYLFADGICFDQKRSLINFE